MMREDWSKTLFGDIILESRNGFTGRPNDERIGNPRIGITSITQSKSIKVDIEDCRYISIPEEKENSYILHEEDIMVCRQNGNLHFVGLFGVVKKKKSGLIFSDSLIRFRLNSDTFLSEFIAYYMNSMARRTIESMCSTTAGNFSINSTSIKSVTVPIVPFPEQRAIVAKIEGLFSDLDNGIADLKKAQRQLAIYRQAVLKKAFDGELTKEWREKNKVNSSFSYLQLLSKERLKIKPNKKSIYHKKITHDFKFSHDINISTWSRATLDKLVYIAARIGWRGLKKSEYTVTGPLFLSVHSLNHGKYVDYSEAFHITKERYDESPEIQLEDGDVLLCKDGAGIGKIGIVKKLASKATVNSSLLVIRGLDVLNQDFLYYLFSGPDLQEIVFERITGSATPHLFQNDIRKFELLIPPKEEQHQIVREIESRLSVCDKVELSITDTLEKSQALRQSILKKAFEGKLLSPAEIENCKQESDYEPASKLLKKIIAEKK